MTQQHQTLNTDSVLPVGVFNTQKVNHTDPRIILGEAPGLLDSVNRMHPVLFGDYKNLKSLDWDENETRLENCIREFDTSHPDDTAIMTDTIAYQWEADSIVGDILAIVTSLTVTNSDVAVYYGRVVDNERLHAMSYSEISKLAFRDPNLIIDKVYSSRETHERMSVVGAIFENARVSALKYALGQATREEVLKDIVLFYCGVVILERCQFMPSFAVTFGYGELGMFLPIVTLVQKICQDELEVHIPGNMYVVREIFKEQAVQDMMPEIQATLTTVIQEVYDMENQWISHTLKGRKVPESFTEQQLIDFNAYSCTYMARFFDIHKNMDFELIDRNPIPYMDKWVNLSLVQTSPQEQDNVQYKLGIVHNDVQDKVYVPRI